MADYDTGRDILTDLLSRAGDLDIGLADEEAEGRRYVLRGYWALCRSFVWLFSLSYPPLQFSTAKKITGTFTVTEGSTAVTVVTPSLPDVSNRHLVIDRDGFPIRIASGSGAALVLSTGYPEVDGVSLSGYVYKDEYNVGDDVLVPVHLRNMMNRLPYDIIPLPEFLQSRDLVATFMDDSRLKIRPVSEKAQLFELVYAKRPAKLDFSGNAATDTPIMPISERWLVADYALYFLLKDQDDDKAESVATIVAGRVAELKDQQIAKIGSRVWLPDNFRIGVQ